MNVWRIILSGATALVFSLLLTPPLSASTAAYTYDSMNRLTRATYDGGSFISYSYDAMGNILSATMILDTDSDGLPDSLENQGCTYVDDADTDDDGIADGVEDANQNGVVDSGETDPCNIDTDGDGLQDGTELGYTLADITADTDTGIFQPDLDPSVTTDPLDPDSDDDGVNDGTEDANHNGRLDSGERDPNKRDGSLPWIFLLLNE